MIDKPNYYSVLTADVRYDNRLTDSEKLLYAEITSLAQKNGECWASNKYFADLYGVHEKTISKRIARLKKFNYLDVKMIYKNGSKEIDKRIIKIATTYERNCSEGMSRNATTPPHANATDNTTSKSNTTSINSNKEIYKESLPFQEIIDYLNLRTGKNYRVTNDVRKSINARYQEKFTLEDFKTVIDKKCVEWIDDPKMNKYLQPSTLFGTKFQNYLNQEVSKPKTNNPFMDALRDNDDTY